MKYSERMAQAGTSRQRTLDIEKHAEEIFGNAEIAQRWLRHPNRATDDKAPLELLAAENGFQRVKILLDRIDYGVLA